MSTPDLQDLSGVSSQRSFIDSRPDKPSPTSTLSIRRFTTSNADGSKDHTVVGVHIVLAKGDPNGLWEALNVDRASQGIAPDTRVATRALTICCDTLELHGEFCVPEARVKVFARQLLWGDDLACINTSPLPWTTPKARDAFGSTAGESGADGRNAGALQIFVHDVKSTAGAARPRLVANGGCGQDPGAGLNGTNGDWMLAYPSQQFTLTDSGISTSRRTVSFSPPAVYINYEWRWGRIRSWGPGEVGENRSPKDGTDALAPGAPGNGGNAGTLTTNVPALAGSFKHDPGAAGAKQRDCYGGSPGSPRMSAHYKLQLWENLFGTDSAHYNLKKTDEHTSIAGKDAPAPAASRGAGVAPPPVVVGVSNAWLHPFSLQAALEYARDLFLAGGRDELLTLLEDYRDALAQPQPTTGGWPSTPASQWTSAQVDVATMIQRLHGQLDYFGHPAGYTPILSLPGAIKLYADETTRALRMMLLTGWVANDNRKASEAAAIATEAISSANVDSQQAADQVAAGERKLAQVEVLIASLENELTDLGNRLVVLRNNLLVKVMNDEEQKAAIKFSIKMAGALCQIIPVGQPALGTIGSLGSVAADFVGGEPDKAPDTLSKMGDVLKKAAEAGKNAKGAGHAAEKAKDAAAPKTSEEAKQTSSAWSTVGKGLGPAVSGMADAIKALQVSQQEVDAELARLESQDPEWNEITRAIKDLNTKKVSLFGDLVDAIHSVGEGFARLSANAAAVVSLQQQREQTLDRMNPDAVYAVSQLGQRSRLTLQKYLYLMVKAYESTLLQPLAVDWKLTDITEQINALLEPGTGFDAAALNAQADALDGLFQQNLSTVREKLLKDFDFREKTLTLRLGLTAKQTPDLLAALNDEGEVAIDPQLYGLILPTEQRARLSGVTLKTIAFDPAGPPLPATCNAIVSMVPATTGTMRREEGLYVLASDAPVRWSWTCLAAGDIRPSTPSAIAQDVLDFILGPGSSTIRQHVSVPPAWSELTVAVQFSPPLAQPMRPRVTDLYFDMAVDSTPAPEFQRMLSIRSAGTPAGAVIGCSPDLANRGDGVGDLVRIYAKHGTVTLSVPDHAGGCAFGGWEVDGVRQNGSTPPPTTVQAQMEDNAFAVANWIRLADHVPAPVVLSRVIDTQALMQIAEQHADANVRAELQTVLAARAAATEPAFAATGVGSMGGRPDLFRAQGASQGVPTPPHGVQGLAIAQVPRPIRTDPQSGAAVVGILSAGGEPDVLATQGAWWMVNFRGVVGWVEAA